MHYRLFMFNVEGLFVRPPLVRWVGLTLGKKNTLLFSLSATNDDSLLAVSDGIGWVGVSLPPPLNLSLAQAFSFSICGQIPSSIVLAKLPKVVSIETALSSANCDLYDRGTAFALRLRNSNRKQSE